MTTLRRDSEEGSDLLRLHIPAGRGLLVRRSKTRGVTVLMQLVTLITFALRDASCCHSGSESTLIVQITRYTSSYYTTTAVHTVKFVIVDVSKSSIMSNSPCKPRYRLLVDGECLAHIAGVTKDCVKRVLSGKSMYEHNT